MAGIFRYSDDDFNPGFVLPEAPVPRPRTVPLPPLLAPAPPVAFAMSADNGVLPMQPDVPVAVVPQEPMGQQPLPPLPPPVMPVEVQPGDQTRPRYVGDETERLISNREKFINDPALKNAPENKPGRLASFLGMFLGGAGESANRVLEGSARSGRPITTGDLLQAVAGGIGGGAAGAIKPKIYADMKHQQEIGQLQEQKARADAQRAQKLDEEAKRSVIERNLADAGETRSKRERDRQKAAFDALKDDIGRQDHYTPGENPALDARIKETGYAVTPFDKRKGETPHFQNTNGENFRWNGKEWERTNLPTDRSEVPDEMGVKPGTRAMADATRAGQLAGVQNTNQGFAYDEAKSERERVRDLSKAQAKVTGAQNELSRLGSKRGQIFQQLQQMKQSGLALPEDIAKLDKEYLTVEDDIAKAQNGLTGAQAEVEGLNTPIPKRAPNVAPERTKVGAGHFLTQADIAAKAKAAGLSVAATRAAAEAQGYTIR